MAYALRTRIKEDIIAEFVRPLAPSSRVIILCGGMPGFPPKKEVLFFLAEKGYWVFAPRYRGSWESGGSFLARSPHEDVVDVIGALSSGFADLYNNKQYKIKRPQVYLIGSSFGGPAVILASKDACVKKTVALSPVIDWRVESKLEKLDWLREFTKSAFGNGYRFKDRDWSKLKNGVFYNPIAEVAHLDKDKLYLIHAKDDEVVYAAPSVRFARELDCKITVLAQGGHLSTSDLLRTAFWGRVSRFLESE